MPRQLRRIGKLAAVIAALLVLFGAYQSGFFFYTGLTPCQPPLGMSADGMATATAWTWQDLNGDGQRDTGEPPLPWVTIAMEAGYPPSITDATGTGRAGQFKPGCACDCWKSESLTVLVPPGYQATTPTLVALTGEEATYAFGFQETDSSAHLTFPDEPEWAQAFINRGVPLTAFHFSDATHTLSLALDTPSEAEAEAAYRDAFNILQGLAEAHIAILRLTLTTTAPARTTTCDLDTVRRWSGKVTYSEILTAYCDAAPT